MEQYPEQEEKVYETEYGEWYCRHDNTLIVLFEEPWRQYNFVIYLPTMDMLFEATDFMDDLFDAGWCYIACDFEPSEMIKNAYNEAYQSEYEEFENVSPSDFS